MWGGYSLCFILAALIAATSAQTEPATATDEQAVNEDSDILGLYDGDVILSEEQESTLRNFVSSNDPFGPMDAVIRDPRRLWPNGRVPYIFDNSLSSRAVDAINAAIETYRRESCIELVQRTNEQDYVRFFAGSGCFSFIGRVGGPQDISIGRGCEFEGIVLHEIFHALGRWHEQSRPDRDMFVRIIPENIRPGTEGNFEITNPRFVTTQGIPYDIRSIMHYSATAFSTNRQPTIEPVDPNTSPNDLGQRQGFTDLDIQHVNTLYCGDDSGQPSGTWSTWGAFSACSRTCNGGTRSRTRTCQGGTDCEGSNIDTQQCNTNSCPAPASWGSWTTWSGCSATCGSGSQRRIRSCVGGNTCVGRNSEFRNCNLRACPEPATWGQWGSWSSCSSTCQGGQRQRTRTCMNGNSCPGAGLQDEECNVNIPCNTPDPNSGEWSSWSPCTVPCGGGLRFRVRQCNVAGSCLTEQENCNTEDCNPEPFLRGLIDRGCWYLNTRTGRLGTLEGFTPDLSDNPLTREDPASKCGVAALDNGFDYFGITLGYCVSGSNLLSDYQYVSSRLCQNGRGEYNRGWFIMNVYEVVDSRSFADSVAANQLGTTEVMTDGSPKLTHSLVMLVGSALLAALYTFY